MEKSSMKDLNICLTSDNNYLKYMTTTMLSILKNSKEDENIIFHLLINDNDINEFEKNKILYLRSIKDCIIKFYSPDLNICQLFFNKSINKNWPLSAFYRLQIPSLIKNVDKLLYLDCDMIVNTSLSELFEIDMKDNIAIVTDSLEKKTLEYYKKRIKFTETDSYFCSGFMLLNNKKLIEDNYINIFKNCLNNVNELYTADEDIFNIAFKNNVIFLEKEWAYIVTKYFYKEPIPLKEIKIIHYGGPNEKPWNENTVQGFYLIEWWKYFVQTEWFKEDPMTYINILINQNINNYHVNKPNFIQNNITNIVSEDRFSIADFLFSFINKKDSIQIIILGIKITIKKKNKE